MPQATFLEEAARQIAACGESSSSMIRPSLEPVSGGGDIRQADVENRILEFPQTRSCGIVRCAVVFEDGRRAALDAQRPQVGLPPTSPIEPVVWREALSMLPSSHRRCIIKIHSAQPSPW